MTEGETVHVTEGEGVFGYTEGEVVYVAVHMPGG